MGQQEPKQLTLCEHGRPDGSCHMCAEYDRRRELGDQAQAARDFGSTFAPQASQLDQERLGRAAVEILAKGFVSLLRRL